MTLPSPETMASVLMKAVVTTTRNTNRSHYVVFMPKEGMFDFVASASFVAMVDIALFV